MKQYASDYDYKDLVNPVTRDQVIDTLVVSYNAVDGQPHSTAIIISLLILIIRIMVYGMEKQDDARLDAEAHHRAMRRTCGGITKTPVADRRRSVRLDAELQESVVT